MRDITVQIASFDRFSFLGSETSFELVSIICHANTKSICGQGRGYLSHYQLDEMASP